VEGDVLVIACGPWSPELARTVGVERPIRPLCRQLLETSALPELPDTLPIGDRSGDRFPLSATWRQTRPGDDPIVGLVADGVYAACGFSGHGFMQSPAVGRALAELILRGESSIDLTPYALERFEAGAVFPEHLVL
jgi:glycine/D-amino acid oxidase-like deaminating enzyme